MGTGRRPYFPHPRSPYSAKLHRFAPQRNRRCRVRRSEDAPTKNECESLDKTTCERIHTFLRTHRLESGWPTCDVTGTSERRSARGAEMGETDWRRCLVANLTSLISFRRWLDYNALQFGSEMRGNTRRNLTRLAGGHGRHSPTRGKTPATRQTDETFNETSSHHTRCIYEISWLKPFQQQFPRGILVDRESIKISANNFPKR